MYNVTSGTGFVTEGINHSSRFGTHVMQSVDIEGAGVIRVSNFSNRTPSFLNRMRESSVRMMSNMNILSNRNSNIMFQSEDSDHIYGASIHAGALSGLMSNRHAQIADQTSKISHLNAQHFGNTASNNSHRNSQANRQTFNVVEGNSNQ